MSQEQVRAPLINRIRPQMWASNFTSEPFKAWFAQKESEIIHRSIREKSTGEAHLLFCAGYHGKDYPVISLEREVSSVDNIANQIDHCCEGSYFDTIDAAYLYYGGSCIAYVDVSGAGNVTLRGDKDSGKTFATLQEAIESQFGPSMCLDDGRTYHKAMTDIVIENAQSPEILERVFSEVASSLNISGVKHAFYDVLCGDTCAAELRDPVFSNMLFMLIEKIKENVPGMKPLMLLLENTIKQFEQPMQSIASDLTLKVELPETSPANNIVRGVVDTPKPRF